MTEAEVRATFQNPPLTEVVLGIQFAPMRNYQQIRAGEVWALYRERYPVVEEHQALAPAFEIFGGPPGPQFDLGFVTSAQHDRFLFVSESQHELLQFQNDRLLYNWRQLGKEHVRYPRFENMAVTFREEAEKLESYSKQISEQGLQINQCELNYTNAISYESGKTDSLSSWLSFIKTGGEPVEDFNTTFRRKIHDRNGNPSGRLICQALSAIDHRSQPVIVLQLAARGRPDAANLDAALEFLCESRDMLVRLFAEVTTDSAHAVWGRE